MKTLIWWTPFCAGGLGDRLLGMVATYCIAKVLNRKFLIKWDGTDMSSVFQINPEFNYYNYRCPFDCIMKNNIESMSYFENTDIGLEWEGKHNVLIWSNSNIFYYFCKNKPDIEYKKLFLEITQNIFRDILLPTDDVKNNLRHDLKDAIGIHIRTHDAQWDSEHEREKQRPYITNIITKCKDHLLANNPTFTKIFIASDCGLSSDIAKEIFGPEYTIITNNGPLIHICKSLNHEGLVRVVTDLISLSECEILYLGWNTNFSRFGALLNPSRTFYTYEHPNSSENMYKCSDDELMNYFSHSWRNVT